MVNKTRVLFGSIKLCCLPKLFICVLFKKVSVFKPFCALDLNFNALKHFSMQHLLKNSNVLSLFRRFKRVKIKHAYAFKKHLENLCLNGKTRSLS